MTEVEMREVLRLYRGLGYGGRFQVTDEGEVQCLVCHEHMAPQEVNMDALHRLEGTSDPAAMAAVLALVCGRCETKGTLVVQYGTEVTPAEAQVLVALQDHRLESSMRPGT